MLRVIFSEEPIAGEVTHGRSAGGKLLEEVPLDQRVAEDMFEHIQYVDPIDPVALSSLDQALVIVSCIDHKSRNPDDAMRQEEMLAYITRVLRDPTDWILHTTSLLLKSRMENTPKTVEVKRNNSCNSPLLITH